MWWRCVKCTAAYAMDADWCPQCGASDVCTAVVDTTESGHAVRCGIRKCEAHREDDAAERRKVRERLEREPGPELVELPDGAALVGDGSGEALPPADDTPKTSKGGRRSR